MRTVMFSDTHFTTHFIPKRYNYLVNILQNADKVIVNGDLFDGYIISFDQFVKSRWNRLFPLLKEKQCIMIYGNHDRPELLDQRVNLFSVKQCYSHTLVNKGQEYIIRHGHKLNQREGVFSPKSNQKIVWAGDFSQRIYETVIYNALNLNRLSYWHKRINKAHHCFAHNTLSHNQWLVCGHNHNSEYNLYLRYINSGMNRCGIGEYAVIDDHGARLVSEKIGLWPW